MTKYSIVAHLGTKDPNEQQWKQINKVDCRTTPASFAVKNVWFQPILKVYFSFKSGLWLRGGYDSKSMVSRPMSLCHICIPAALFTKKVPSSANSALARWNVILHTFNLFVFRYFIEDLRYDAKGTVKIPLVYPVTSVHYTSLWMSNMLCTLT